MPVTSFRDVSTVVHQGIVFAFASCDEPSDNNIYYNVLDMQANPADPLNWAGFQVLEFPETLRPAGMEIVNVTAAGIIEFAEAPFQALTDQTYIYVFRQTTLGTLCFARFSMTQKPPQRNGQSPSVTLSPAWEVRFQRSGKKDIPGTDRDVQTFEDPNREPFIEPIIELSMVRNLTQGWFVVLLVPSQANNAPRWQVAAYNTSTKKIDLYSFGRTSTGLFDLSDKRVDQSTSSLPPDSSFAVDFGGIPLSITSGLGGTVYYKQEPAVTADGKSLMLKRNGRVMLAFGTSINQLAVIDFAIAADGTLAPVADPATLGAVGPAPQSLYFNNMAFATPTNNHDSLSLTGSFSLGCWIYSKSPSSGVLRIIGGDPAPPAATQAPFIDLKEGSRITAGFGDGTELRSVTTTGRVISPSVWTHITAVFDSSSGTLTIFVNGVPAESAIFAGSNPTGAPISVLSGFAGGFQGDLDEIAVWKIALDQKQVNQFLYEEIEKDTIEQGDVVAYWPCNEARVQNGVLVTPDLSTYGNDLVLQGARLASLIPPVSSATCADGQIENTGPEVQVSNLGLTVECGLLRFVATPSAPFLIQGSDGLVHLYFRGPQDEFNVAQYDVSTARAIYYAPWGPASSPVLPALFSDDTPEKGLVAFIAKRTGTIMNLCTVDICSAVLENQCNVKFSTPYGAAETWNGVPRSLDRFVAVLNGQAVGDPGDPALKAGTKTFYDYDGIYPAAQIPVPPPSPQGETGEIMVVTRRPDRGGETSADALPLGSVTINAASGNTVDVTLSFSPPGNKSSIPQTWPSVPADVPSFISTLSGLNSLYDYGQIREGSPLSYSLTAGKLSRVLLYALDGSVTAASITITRSSGGNADECDILLTVTTTTTLEFKLENQPRDQRELAAAFRAASSGDVGLSDLFTVSTDLLKAIVPNQEITSPDDLLAGTSLFTIFNSGAEGNVGAVEPIPAQILQGATASHEEAALSFPSALFGVAPASAPPAGIATLVQKPTAAQLGQSGTTGGWVEQPPGYAVSFNQNDVAVDLTTETAFPLDIKGDLTLEAWVNAQGGEGSGFPRVLNYNKVGNTRHDSTQYVLGLRDSFCLGLVGDNGPETTVALVGTNQQGTGSSQLDRFFTSSSYSVQLWIKVDLKTPFNADSRSIWAIFGDPHDGGQNGDLLSLASGGSLVFTSGGLGLSDKSLLAGRTVDSGEWVHVTLVSDGRTAKFFLNGVPDNSNPTYPVPTHEIGFSLGGAFFGGGVWTEMKVNALRLWNRALSDAEVADNYNIVIPPDAPGLVLSWMLAEGTGNTAINSASTGSNYNGSIQPVQPPPHWESPGMFFNLMAGNRDTVQVSKAALVTFGEWAHLAAAYRVGRSIKLTGSDYGDCGNNASLNFTSAFSIEAWIEPTIAAAPDVRQVLVSKWGADPSEHSYEFGLDENLHPYLTVMVAVTNSDSKQDSNQQVTVVAAAPVATDSTYHVVGTFTTGTETITVGKDDKAAVPKINLDLYVNGAAAGSIQFPNPLSNQYTQLALVTSTTSVNLGRTQPDAPRRAPAPGVHGYYSGYLSGVRLWNQALPAAQVHQIYTQRQQGKDNGVISCWAFGEMKGKVAADIAGQNDATLSSNRLWEFFHGSGKLFLYVNGAPAGAIDPVEENQIGGYGVNQFRIGGMHDDKDVLDFGLIALIDEVRVWSMERTGEQIDDSMFTYLSGQEANLAGYWQFDNGSGITVDDMTGRGNPGKLEPDKRNVLPSWVISTAPLSNEAPVVRNILGGIETPYVGRVSATPAAVEYPDTEVDANGKLQSVMKRFYISTYEGKIALDTGFKVGDLNTTYIGQVQTDPTVIGYVEGAPPLPSENLTQPYYMNSTLSDYLAYFDASSLKLIESDETKYTFSSTRESGFDMSIEFKAGLRFKNELTTGEVVPLVGVLEAIKAATEEAIAGVHGTFEFSIPNTSANDAAAGFGTTLTNEIGSGGNWESPDANGKVLNPTVGTRFIPSNTGYALVKSLTANMYAVTLRSTGALVSIKIVPDPEIPVDVNIIPFEIDPSYTKNGTLDGNIGLQPDPQTVVARENGLRSASYFRPVEAYAAKREIEAQTVELQAYWTQFDAEGKGKSPSGDIGSLVDSDVFYDWKQRLARRSMVNTYVWSSETGLYKQEENFLSSRTESYGGKYHFTGLGGAILEAKGAILGVGLFGEGDFLFGGHIDVEVSKTSESSVDFGMEIDLKCESFLKKYMGGNQGSQKGGPDDYSSAPTPGKVTDYRFMSFYRAPSEENFKTLFSKVIDQDWLRFSTDPNAVALRQARSSSNGVWRVYHRVTFVSRVPPPFQASPSQSQSSGITAPANLPANIEMIQLVLGALGPILGTTEGVKTPPTALQIGHAISTVLGNTLLSTLPWWQVFMQAAQIYNSAAQLTLRELRTDLLSYLEQGFASQAITLKATRT